MQILINNGTHMILNFFFLEESILRGTDINALTTHDSQLCPIRPSKGHLSLYRITYTEA